MVRLCIALETPAEHDCSREDLDRWAAELGCAFEVVVDRTAHRPHDERVRAVDAGRPGSASLTNLVLAAAQTTSAPFVLWMNVRQRWLPGGPGKLIEAAQTDPGADHVLGLQFEADPAGNASRAAWHRQWEAGLAIENFPWDELPGYWGFDFLSGNVRLFGRDALMRHGEDLSACRSKLEFCRLAHRLMRWTLVRDPVCIEPAGDSPARQRPSLAECLSTAAGLSRTRKNLSSQLAPMSIYGGALNHFLWKSRAGEMRRELRHRRVRWTIRSGWDRRMYRAVVGICAAMGGSAGGANGAASRRHAVEGRKHVGYFIWQYPVLSQTFVQREVAGLRKAGERISVFAMAESQDGFIEALRPWLDGTGHCLAVSGDATHRHLKTRFLLRHPLRYLRLRVWVTGTDYHELKDRWFDRDLFHSALRLADAAEQNAIDHIHSPWADTCAFIALVAARLLNVPYSVQARAHDIHRVDYRYALREKLGQAAFVVTNTRYNFEHIARIVGKAQASRIHVIHNGLNLAQFRPPRRAGHQGPVRLLCVARLIDQKGIEELLRACRKLSDAGVDLRCDIVGGFEDIFMRYYVGLKRLHRDLELQSLVHFAGSRPFEDMLDFYRRADLFVLPCVIAPDGSRDIIPNSVLEAMAMALPVVSTTVTGLPEMVDDGRTGFLVPPHDVDALATAIGKLARSHRMREDFGRAGRAKVEASFDIDANAAQYRALFASDPNACREAAARG